MEEHLEKCKRLCKEFAAFKDAEKWLAMPARLEQTYKKMLKCLDKPGSQDDDFYTGPNKGVCAFERQFQSTKEVVQLYHEVQELKKSLPAKNTDSAIIPVYNALAELNEVLQIEKADNKYMGLLTSKLKAVPRVYQSYKKEKQGAAAAAAGPTTPVKQRNKRKKTTTPTPAKSKPNQKTPLKKQKTKKQTTPPPSPPENLNDDNDTDDSQEEEEEEEEPESLGIPVPIFNERKDGNENHQQQDDDNQVDDEEEDEDQNQSVLVEFSPAQEESFLRRRQQPRHVAHPYPNGKRPHRRHSSLNAQQILERLDRIIKLLEDRWREEEEKEKEKPSPSYYAIITFDDGEEIRLNQTFESEEAANAFVHTNYPNHLTLDIKTK